MAQWIKVLTGKPGDLSSIPGPPGRRELTPASCPLTSTQVLWYEHSTLAHIQKIKKCNEKLKKIKEANREVSNATDVVTFFLRVVLGTSPHGRSRAVALHAAHTCVARRVPQPTSPQSHHACGCA